MKRHPALRPMSRDHHDVLLVARELRREEPGEARAAELRETLRRAWRTWAREFWLESARWLAALAGPAELLARCEAGSAEVVRAVDGALAGEPSRADLRAVGGLLHDEVRWRERELFQVLQESALPEQLARLRTHWEEVEATRARSAGG